MFWFFAIPILLVVGTIIIIEVSILCYETIKEAVKEFLRSYLKSNPNTNMDALEAYITKKMNEGGIPVINVGLTNKSGHNIEEFKIKPTESIDYNDYYVGQKIPIPV